VRKVWLDSYPEGIPAELPPAPFRSVRELFEQAFDAWPDRPAYHNMGTTLNYRQLDELSMKFACFLQQSLGLVRGERVAVMMPNLLQYPVVLCGAFRAGLVLVNVNPLYTSRELEHQLSDSGARCIVILENFAHTLDKVVANTDIDHVVTTAVGDLLEVLATRHRRPLPAIEPAAREALVAYDWPGNVRELANALERALVLSRGDGITAESLPDAVLAPAGGAARASTESLSLEDVERRHVQQVLASSATLEEAATRLGIDPTTLWRKRKRWGLD